MKKSAVDMMARRFTVRGRVQGVGFRYFVVEAAERLALAGWTRNTADGAVEVVAQGSGEALDALADLLLRGPGGARVASVEAGSEPVEETRNGFVVRH